MTPPPPPQPPASAKGAVEHFSGVLHEVSNALTVVLGWLDMAARAESMQGAQEAIHVALEHARRGQEMARRGIGAETTSLHVARSAGELTRFAATSVEPQASRGGVRIVAVLGSATESRLEADSCVLQVLTNLLLNAIDFTPSQATVTLSVRRAEQNFIFRVQDQGPGVPESIREGLFESAVSLRAGGAGIGLPYSRALARQNRGELRLLSPSESGTQGACFELTWPVSRSTGVAAGPPDHVRAALSGARVLLIEDDLAIATLIELTLDAYGGRVLVLTSPEEVEETLRGRPVFDAALVDLSPIKDRLLGTLDRLKVLSPEAPVILMSGEPGGVPEEAMGHFASWVRKPFDMDQLLSTLGTLLDVSAPPLV